MTFGRPCGNVFGLVAFWLMPAAMAVELHVSPGGDDANPGTHNRPLATVAAAQRVARESGNATVLFHAGTWYWPAFNLADSAITLGAGLAILDSFRHRPPA